MNERDKFVATLEAAHTFPGSYTFKLIGPNEARFVDEALQIVRDALPDSNPDVSRRESGKGNHQSVTLVADVPDAGTVHDIYLSLKKIDGLALLL